MERVGDMGGEVEEEEAKAASFTSWCKFLFTDVDKRRFWGRLRSICRV